MKIVIILLTLISNLYAAQGDQQAKIYDRCYFQLINDIPQDTDPYLRRIRQGSLSGAEACMNLIGHGKFVNGQMQKVEGESNMDKLAFKDSLYAYTRSQSCNNCHDSSHSRPHSSDSIDQAFSSAQSLVNFDTPESSTIYTKILNGHQCQGNECTEKANRIKNEIVNWKEDKKYFQEFLYQPLYGNYSKLGLEVIKSLTLYQRTWFSIGNYINIHGVPGAMLQIHDMNENAYYFTRSIFGDLPLSSVLTTDHSLEAIRYTKYPYIKFFTHKKNGVIWNDAPYAPLGKIIGFKQKTDYVSDNGDGQQVNFTGNFGGGILGTQSYLMYNINGVKVNTKEEGRSDGALRMYRRWSQAVFNDVLCRELPVVREEDATKYVSFQSDLPFRGGTSCMQCHSSMDPVARTVRNLHPDKPGADIIIADRHPATLPPSVHETGETNGIKNWPDVHDADFHKRQPVGNFYFRDYKGFLHDINTINGTSGLGEVISQTEDFYLCTAKRYFKFFTGVDIPIFDPGYNNPGLNAKEQEYYDFIKKLAIELKGHQDLKQTFDRIFKSKAFELPGKGVE